MYPSRRKTVVPIDKYTFEYDENATLERTENQFCLEPWSGILRACDQQAIAVMLIINSNTSTLARIGLKGEGIDWMRRDTPHNECISTL